MRPFKTWGLIMGMFFNFSQGCSPQESNQPLTDRKPAVAGQFYPADPAALRQTLADLFARAKPRNVEKVAAVITPHAGYVFSGVVAASSFNQIDPDMEYDNIFVIASSHQVSFMGASVYDIGDYVTPLGKVPVNIPLAKKLIEENQVFTFNPEADHNEHSLEVQIPFLQYHMKKPFRIVPIVIGSQSPQSCKKIADALKPYFTPDNLFVISTDFSHYPAYADAKIADQATCDAILSNDPDQLIRLISDYKKKDVPNLVTNLCGWTSVLSLLYMTCADPAITLKPVNYMNSGEAKYGDKSQVVGYWSIVATRTAQPKREESGFSFTAEEKVILLGIARKTINRYIREGKKPEIDTKGFTRNLSMKAGAFVTLKENGALRGCIGRFTSDIPLWEVIVEMAIASSTQDNRFEPVTAKEIDRIEIEISVLSPMKRIYSADEIVMGKHGIYVKKGWYSGTFLPQVAAETGWSREEFLGHCARDKAGIGWDGWKEAELYTYEACVFSEQVLSGRKH
jgi:AmmeMemoRadiSam system protein B/AmmeMemoRadiSam system protein A